jgi:glycosyltransferase involved in cell wall biosynthesis
VLFISGSLTGGGAERVTSNLLAHLDRSRLALSLCLIRGRISYPLPEDVPLTILNDPRSRSTADDLPLARRARLKPWVVWNVVRQLRRHIEERRPDLVVSNIDQVNCVTGAALRGMRSAPPWIARIGNNPFFTARWLRPWRKRCYQRATLVVANSSGLADGFRALYRLDCERVQVIGNPTDFDKIAALAAQNANAIDVPPKPLLVSAGRLCRQKRFDVLLDAFAQVRRRVDARLCICGEGPLRKTLQKDIARLGLQQHVSLLGFCDNPYSWMSRAAVFVNTSDYEGLPNALIEAQGLGVPAVATRCDYGPDEIIDPGTTGYLVPTGDAPAVAESIEKLVADVVGRREMGNAAAARMRRLYDVHKVVGDWEALLSRNSYRVNRPFSGATATLAWP